MDEFHIMLFLRAIPNFTENTRFSMEEVSAEEFHRHDGENDIDRKWMNRRVDGSWRYVVLYKNRPFDIPVDWNPLRWRNDLFSKLEPDYVVMPPPQPRHTLNSVSNIAAMIQMDNIHSLEVAKESSPYFWGVARLWGEAFFEVKSMYAKARRPCRYSRSPYNGIDASVLQAFARKKIETEEEVLFTKVKMQLSHCFHVEEIASGRRIDFRFRQSDTLPQPPHHAGVLRFVTFMKVVYCETQDALKEIQKLKGPVLQNAAVDIFRFAFVAVESKLHMWLERHPMPR